MKQDHRTKLFSGGRMPECAKKYIQYNIPNRVNNITINIIK